MDNYRISEETKRLGIHYYQDTDHYREIDLQYWLPELLSLGISWLTLVAPADRAIPESFISGLIQAGIEPILHFQFNLMAPTSPDDLSVLFSAYTKWGVRFAIFFDRPNCRASWPASSWAQEDLVERFIDRFAPIADLAVSSGLTPVFPPLQPGGDYWDTAFLNSSLHSLRRRKKDTLLDKLALSAYPWTYQRSLNWGAGGPERWPASRPYFTPAQEEDQQGFRIFDWYQAIARSNIHHSCPIILLQSGCASNPFEKEMAAFDAVAHAQTSLAMARLVNGEVVNDPAKPEVFLEPIPADVICCNFWLLSDSEDNQHSTHAWYRAENQTLPIVSTLRQWASRKGNAKKVSESLSEAKTTPLIDHYLLLPMSEAGFSKWNMEALHPFVLKYHPTIGFSIQEAAHATKVTVVGDAHDFSDDDLISLRNAGSIVDRISGDGTSIASQLAER